MQFVKRPFTVAFFAILGVLAVMPAAAQPVILDVTVVDVTHHTATISVTTDVPTLADFSLDPVGSPGASILMDNDGVLKTSHSVVLDTLYFELQPNTRLYRPAAGLEYTFEVTVTDASDGTAVESGGFTTPDYANDPVSDWLLSDIDNPSPAGQLRFDNTDSSYAVFGSGTSLFNKRDNLTYLYQPVSGNFEVGGQVSMYGGVMGSHTKGGVLFRGESDHVLGALYRGTTIHATSINYSSEEVLYYRPEVDSNHVEVTRDDLQAADGDSIWVRMRREGNDFAVSYSNDGSIWTVFHDTLNIPLPLDGLAGVVGLSLFSGYWSEVTYRDLYLETWADTTAPEITADATPVNNTADISWTSNEWVTVLLEYGTTIAYGDSLEVDTMHVGADVNLSGLEFETEYHYRITAWDSDSNQVVTGDMTFITEPDNPLAVQLAGFFGRVVEDREVEFGWTILSHDGIELFEVERRSEDGFVPVGSVGATDEDDTYRLSVSNVDYGRQSYRLKITALDGSVSFSYEIELLVDHPGGFAMTDAYPNPFNHAATFSLTVRQPQRVSVSVYNLAGQRVAEIFDGTVEAETSRQFVIDGSGLADGVYIYSVRGETFVTSDKVVVVR